MSPQSKPFVIVGASLTGAKAAEALRAEGFTGQIIVLGAEAERPYERPPLSKEYLRGEAEEPPYVHEEGYYRDEGIDLRLSTRVVDVDTDAAEVVVEGGERIGYGRLLLATGAEPRRLPVPGAELEGVHYLRSLAESQRLGERIERGARVAVIGAGWIGAEFAASARQKGNEVTLIELGSVPLERVLGPELGAVYRDVHEDHGVRFLGGSTVAAIEGAGRAEGVRLGSGELIGADLVLVGIGVAPRTELAERAGIETDNGIVVDAGLQTATPGVFAAGDVANAFHPFYGRQVRVEHWANALGQGEAAGRAMFGDDVSYDEIPYFFSDQYEVGMEYRGLADGSDELVFRGDVAGREFIAFWLADGRLVAGMNVNVWDVSETIAELIRSRVPLDRARLADSDVALDSLLSRSA